MLFLIIEIGGKKSPDTLFRIARPMKMQFAMSVIATLMIPVATLEYPSADHDT